MIGEFSAAAVTRQVLAHLERRRADIAGDDARVRAEVGVALEPVRSAYREAELPPAYLAALEREVTAAVPAQWRRIAEPYTALEQRNFRLWRGGDPVARIVFVFIGLAVGGLCVELPFIPIWEKWFPFALAIGAWWLPDLQVRWQRRRYARALGRIVESVAAAQPALEQHVTTKELMS
jgi:hypothetical protein